MEAKDRILTLQSLCHSAIFAAISAFLAYQEPCPKIDLKIGAYTFCQFLLLVALLLNRQTADLISGKGNKKAQHKGDMLGGCKPFDL
ncbi:MAG: hypothetical protein KF862_07290 [Chitinophagaceae bacterium]|nr:hypothetical protein [Chitinophagaceae bacterium]